jgi:hypothetical protein
MSIPVGVSAAASSPSARIAEDPLERRYQCRRTANRVSELGSRADLVEAQGAVASVDIRLLPDPGDRVARTVAPTIAGEQIASVFVAGYGMFRLPQRDVSALGPTWRLTG